MPTSVKITLIICGTLFAAWAYMWKTISQDMREIQNRKDDEK